MRGKGQEYAQAEDFERVLPADDRRPQPTRFQHRPLAGNEPHRHHRQRQKMRKAQRVEIDLIDRVDQLLQPVRNVLAHAGQIPGQRNDEGEQEIRDRYAQGDPRLQHRPESLRSPQRAPGAEHEQQLPGKWIEIPMSAGIAR